MAEQDITPIDDEHARNLKVSAMVGSGETERLAAAAPKGTTQDGLDDAPSHREGEVWESMAAEDDELGGGRRRIRVQHVEDGVVAGVNLVTGTVSHIQAENLAGPHWRRTHA